MVPRGGQADHHRQENHAEDVVEDSGAQDDARYAGMQRVQVGEHARRDAHAGGNHGGGDEGGLMRRDSPRSFM